MGKRWGQDELYGKAIDIYWTHKCWTRPKGRKLGKNKVGLLVLGKLVENVSKACKILGYSSCFFYRYEEFYETDEEASIMLISLLACKLTLIYESISII